MKKFVLVVFLAVNETKEGFFLDEKKAMGSFSSVLETVAKKNGSAVAFNLQNESGECVLEGLAVYTFGSVILI